MSARFPQMYNAPAPSSPNPYAQEAARESANLSSIGDLLLTPSQPGRARSNTVTQSHPAQSVKGQFGEIQDYPQPHPQSMHGQFGNTHDFPQPQSPHARSNPHPHPQSQYSEHDFPSPSIRHSDFPSPSPAPSPVTSLAPLPSDFNPPISPHLAAPPKAHFVADDNASIKGFDHMREKNSTFREGEDELFTPFSPRARQPGPRRKSVYSTVDFWKRFSVAQHKGVESEWIAARRKRVIWKNPYFVVPFIMTIVGLAAIITFVVIHVKGKGVKA